MAKAVQTEAYDHTSLLWFAVRQLVFLVARVFGSKDGEEPELFDVHPYRLSESQKPIDIDTTVLDKLLQIQMLPARQRDAAFDRATGLE